MKEINRIHILGASGSGTTTLAAALSSSLGFIHFDTDDYYWIETNPKFLEKRSVDERLTMLNNDFEKSDQWVLSGSLCGWGDSLIPKFDLVIFLKLPHDLRMSRLFDREKERYGDQIEAGKSWHINHLKFMEWASAYDDGGEEIRSLLMHNNWLDKLTCDVLRIEGVVELDEKLRIIEAFINR